LEPWRPIAARHWSFGKWNLAGTLALWGSSQLYPFLVAGMLGLGQVGLLNGSIRIMGVSNVLIQGIEAFATPRLRRKLVEDEKRSYQQALMKVFLSGLAVMLPICLLVMIFPDVVLRVVLGSQFEGAAFVLRIMALTQLLTFLCRIASLGLNSLKESKPGFWGQAVCAIATVLLGPMIISHYGLDGACLALLVNSMLNFLILIS
jgi:O-antigen/teichoic acid export membrane protein